MKKVLVISYYFPPMGMGGVQRTLKFAKYLPRFGWTPTVLTVKEVAYDAYDATLLKEAAGLPVIRTGSLDPLRLRWKWDRRSRIRGDDPGGHPRSQKLERMNRRLIPWFFLPDSKLLWLPFAFTQAIRLLRSEPFDLIFTTSPPHSAHLLGARLKRAAGLPWVADFRDDWLGASPDTLPTSFHRWMNTKTAVRTIRQADRLIGVSRPITERMLEATGRNSRDFFTIFNGYDRDDFEGIKATRSDRFRIVYTGTLSPVLNPEPFFRGVARAIADHPDVRSVLSIRLFGAAVGIDLKSMLRAYDLESVTEIAGYRPHTECIRELIRSDMLLFILPGSMDEGMVTGKIFEYLAAGKPILALTPKGEAERLIIEHARGVVVPPENVEIIANQILRAYTLWKRRDLRLTVTRWEGIEDYERRQLTRDLAGVFQTLVP